MPQCPSDAGLLLPKLQEVKTPKTHAVKGFASAVAAGYAPNLASVFLGAHPVSTWLSEKRKLAETAKARSLAEKRQLSETGKARSLTEKRKPAEIGKAD